jgi:hypothetical protein
MTTTNGTANGTTNGHAPRIDLGPPAGDPLTATLARLAESCGALSVEHNWYVVGYPQRPSGRPLRLPVLIAPSPEVVKRERPPADGSNADCILAALSEATRPLALMELGKKATGTEPNGAFRRAMQKMVRDKVVLEHAGPPRTYELVRRSVPTPSADTPAKA